MNRVAFYTLGCKLNFSETSTLSRQFQEHGYEKVSFEESADIYVINTCSVTENADRKCRKIVRDALRINPEAYVLIVGCYAQLKPREISEIPGVSAVLGAAEKFRLFEILKDFSKKEQAEVHACEIEETKSFHSSYSVADRTRTFLKVQDGCNYNCTFCTIPLARGKSRSDTIEHVLEQAKKIRDQGIKEIVLTGVNTGDFGIVEGKRKYRFIDLIRRLDEIEGISRFRISSIEPNLLTDEIIEFVSQSQRFVPHFHIPLQSGNDLLLKAMRRRYQRSLYESRVQKIKELMPEACIGVDVIVGFPGETDELFHDSYNFINALDVSYLHVFTYSERPNTEAVHFEGVVPQAIRYERSSMLRSLSEKKKRYFYQQFEGEEFEVLIENDTREGQIFGFTPNYIRVGVSASELQTNELVRVKLDQVAPEGFMSGSVLVHA